MLPSPSAKKHVEVPFDIQEWRKNPGKLVTRGELWEILARMERGRRVRNRWDRRLKRLGRRLWNWLSGHAIEVEDPYYR